MPTFHAVWCPDEGAWAVRSWPQQFANLVAIWDSVLLITLTIIICTHKLSDFTLMNNC